MKKTLIFLFLVLFGFSGAQAQLLYRISKDDMKSASYIFGTHHLAEVAFLDKVPGIHAVIDSVEQVYGEVNIETMTSMASMVKMQKMMMLPDGKTIKDILTPEQFNTLNAFFKDNMGTSFDNELFFSQMGYLRPAALETSVVTLLYVSEHPATNIMGGIDNYFQKEAKKRGMTIGGFETAEYQANLLFVDTPLEDQVKSLMCTIENKDYSLDVLNRLTEAYFKQDIEEMANIDKEQKENVCDVPDDYNQKLVYDRNANWVKQMPALMSVKPTFFAVGALHLCGEQGVLQLLRNEGYTVEAVK